MKHDCLENLVEHMVEVDGIKTPGYSYCQRCGAVFLPSGEEKIRWRPQELNHFKLVGTKYKVSYENPVLDDDSEE